LWPFDKLSPWNRPLGAHAVYEPIQSALTGAGFSAGGLNYRAWTVAVWLASPSDPVRRIYYERWGGRLVPPGSFVERRVPAAAEQSPDRDALMLVISPDRRTVLEAFHAVRLPTGDFKAEVATEVDLKGMGDIGVVTNGMSMLGGNIRAGELRTGINHVLAFTTSGKMWNRHAPGGRPRVWPARWADSCASRGTCYGSTGNLYLGSWVAIPPTVNLHALGLETPEGQILARALQDYGAIGTTTAAGVKDRIIFRYDYVAYKAGDLNSLLANWPAFQRDLNRLARHLQLVANSHDNGAAPSLDPTEGIGGGPPRTAFASDFPSTQGQPIELAAATAGVMLLRGHVRRRRR